MSDEKLVWQLVKNGIFNEELTVVDKSNIRDWFWFKFWDVVEKDNYNEIVFWVNVLSCLEVYAHRMVRDNTKLTSQQAKECECFSKMFFDQGQLLSIKYNIAIIPHEKINKADFEESFKHTLQKLKKVI